MSGGIVFHDFTPIKQIELKRYALYFFQQVKVTTGSTSGIIFMKFRDLSKIIPKMNWSNVDILIGKKRNIKTIYIFKLKYLQVQKQG